MNARWSVVAAAAVVAGLGATVPAKAETHVGIGIVLGGGGSRYQGDAYRIGFDRGRAEGSRDGYDDGRHRRDSNLWRHSEFRDGDRGYRRGMGARAAYVDGFRQGYSAAYHRAYESARPHRYDRYDRYDRRDRDRRYDDDRRYDEDRRRRGWER
jgi:hypothetical protein